MAQRRVIRRAADEALMTPRPVPDDGDEADDQHQDSDDRRDYPPGFGNSNTTALPGTDPMADGYRIPPWYLTKRLLTVVAVAVIVALAVWGIIGVLRSPPSGDQDSPAVSRPTGEPAPPNFPIELSRGDPIEVGPVTRPKGAGWPG
jgi:hypothetical protein